MEAYAKTPVPSDTAPPERLDGRVHDDVDVAGQTLGRAEAHDVVAHRNRGLGSAGQTDQSVDILVAVQHVREVHADELLPRLLDDDLRNLERVHRRHLDEAHAVELQPERRTRPRQRDDTRLLSARDVRHDETPVVHVRARLPAHGQGRAVLRDGEGGLHVLGIRAVETPERPREPHPSVARVDEVGREQHVLQRQALRHDPEAEPHSSQRVGHGREERPEVEGRLVGLVLRQRFGRDEGELRGGGPGELPVDLGFEGEEVFGGLGPDGGAARRSR